MRKTFVVISLGVLAAGCHVAQSQPISAITRTRAFIDERMPTEHPARGTLLVYASSLNETLEHPDDRDMVHATLKAANCLGLMQSGHLVGDTRREIDRMLSETPGRAEAFRRYVVESSTVALTREETECTQL